MADLEATQVHCPECNAVLDVDEGATTATCQYCGTKARIQRRTSFLQRKVTLPPPQDHEPRAIAKQVFKRDFRFYVVMFAPFAIPVVMVLGIYLVATTSKQWMGGPPLVVDVDGDGVDDMIGLIRYVKVDKITLAAYSGADGHRLWETASLGSYSTVRHSLPALAGDTIVRNAGLAGMFGYALKTGEVRWHVKAEDAVDRVCASVAGELVIRAATGTWWTLALATGALRPTAAPSQCGRLMTTKGDAIDADVVPIGTVHVDGMAIQSLLAHGNGPKIAIGWRTPGSGFAMIAAVDATGATLWHALIARDDRFVAALQPYSFALDDREVALVYWYDSPIAPELVVFDRVTGARKFDTPLEKTKSTADGIALTRTSVAVSQWGNLQIYDRATGHEKFAIP